MPAPTRRSLPLIPDPVLIAMGWIGTGLALLSSKLPFQLLLKEQLGYSPTALAGFLMLANIPIYVKPLAGVLSDAVPLFGTRRRHYLLLGLVLSGLFWLLLALVPRTFHMLLGTYFTLNLFLTLTSTVLGGMMVEVGKRDGTTGLLSAQRMGIIRFTSFAEWLAGAVLAKLPFLVTGAVCAAFTWVLVPIFWLFHREAPSSRRDPTEKLTEVKRQTVTLFRSRTLWSAAGLVMLVIAAPGFETPLLYFQRDRLGFSTGFIGFLNGVVKPIAGMAGALVYAYLCRRFPLRTGLAVSILLHAALTPLYLAYRTPTSAIVLTAVEGATLVLALLPLYDLSARATPRGSEALGYSLMMSVWNFTLYVSDFVGSTLYDRLGLTFANLIWVNAGSTALVLIAVPFLPSVLMDRRDGEPDRAP
jgi:hypothetical protein